MTTVKLNQAGVREKTKQHNGKTNASEFITRIKGFLTICIQGVQLFEIRMRSFNVFFNHADSMNLFSRIFLANAFPKFIKCLEMSLICAT